MLLTDEMINRFYNEIAKLRAVEAYLYDQGMDRLGVIVRDAIAYSTRLANEMRGGTRNDEA